MSEPTTAEERAAACSHKHDDGSSAWSWGSENPVNAPCTKCGTAISVVLVERDALQERVAALLEALEYCEAASNQPHVFKRAAAALKEGKE